MNKPYFCQDFFLTDWRHKRLKNTIDLLLFYGEHFYGFSEHVLPVSNLEAVAQRCSVKKVFLETYKIRGKTPRSEACNFIIKETLAQVFRPSTLWKKNSVTEHLRWLLL